VRDDGSVLTEFPAIATWLARKNPEKGLLPSDADAEARAFEAMDYVVSTMHMQGFSRMFRPANYAPTEADHDKVKARGKEIMEKGLAILDKALEGKEYIAGKFSIADAALFYIEYICPTVTGLVSSKGIALCGNLVVGDKNLGGIGASAVRAS